METRADIGVELLPPPVAALRPSISSVVLKVASPCNLNCDYCYIYNHEDQAWKRRPKLLSSEVFDAFLARVDEYAREFGHRMSIVFHGGEPTLIGWETLAGFVAKTRATLGERLAGLSMQTNGTLIDAAWADALKDMSIGVGVSIDGPPEVHDAARKYHNGKGSHADSLRAIELLRDRGMEPYALSVVNPAFDGGECFRYFRQLGFKRMDFLLPDVSWDNKQRFYGELGPTPVGKFYSSLIDAWFQEDDPEVVVRTPYGLLRGLIGGLSGETDAFGNPPMGYVIVETDGAIEALDALRVCAEGIGGTGLNVLRNGFAEVYTATEPALRRIYTGMALPTACQACPERKICGGGYLPHRYSRARGFDNPSVWCEDIQMMLGSLRRQIGDATGA
jgi:uncharacterized protein